VTLSMKNMFGIMPGMFYGWPKNILHVQGIDRSIVDINTTMKPHFAIVDDITGTRGPRFPSGIEVGMKQIRGTLRIQSAWLCEKYIFSNLELCFLFSQIYAEVQAEARR
jgi:hypothetical protein